MEIKKVVLTKEQELATQKWIDSGYSFRAYIKDFGKWSKDFKPLNDIKPEDFSLVLSGWYEVEGEGLEVGDWVQSEYTGSYFKVSRGDLGEGKKTLTKGYVESNGTRFNKVTEKWKVILLENGRLNCEFVIGDIIITESCVYEIESEADMMSARIDAESGYIIKVALDQNVSRFGE